MLAHAVRRVPLAVWAILIALLPLLLHFFSALANLPIGSGEPIARQDPDSWLRLTLVRDWLSGGGWYDHSYASNAPLATVQSPWTRPLDIVIAFFTKLQFGDVELTTKIVRASLILPMMWMTLMVAALLHITRRLTRMPHAILLVGVLLIAAPINYNYFSAGNADHHAPLAAIFCWIVALLLNHDPRRGNGLIAIGALLALMLWISPESILIIAIIYGWLGLQWLAGSSLRPLVRVATATALFAIVAIMIERPFAQWTARMYDSISLVQVLPLVLVALAAMLLARITSYFWMWRALAAAALLCAMGVALYLLDPLLFRGPMALVDPYIHSEFLPRIAEAKHAWSNPTFKFIGLLLQPLLAVFVAFRCATQRNGILSPAHAATLCYLLLATGALYFAQIRWAYYFFPLVPLVLAPFLGAWLNPQHSAVASYWPAARLRRLSERQLMARRIPLLLAILALPIILIILPELLRVKDSTTQDAAACHDNVRRFIQSGELAKLGNGKPLIIFAPTDNGTEILFFTPHRIIASNYHREGAGIRDVWGTHTVDQLQNVVKKRKVDMVITCPDPDRPDAKPFRAAWLQAYKIKTKLKPKAQPSIFLVKGSAR